MNTTQDIFNAIDNIKNMRYMNNTQDFQSGFSDFETMVNNFNVPSDGQAHQFTYNPQNGQPSRTFTITRSYTVSNGTQNTQ